MTTSPRRRRLLSRFMIVVAGAALAAAIIGSFWPLDNSAGVGCGSVIVSSSEAADRDDALSEKALQALVASNPDPNGSAYQGTLLSPGDPGYDAVLAATDTSNASLCADTRSSVRTYLYSSAATALVLAGIGWLWLRRRVPPPQG